MITEATDETFDELVNGEYAVVDCYGDYCGACVILRPVYEEAAADFAGITFLKINVSSNFQIAERFHMDAMPTLLFFRNGKEVHCALGSMDRAELNAHIGQMLYH